MRKKPIRKPDFFIVGAPKCGTTALALYLSSHPRIFMPGPNEPLFFGSDVWGPVSIRTHEEYMALFRKVRPHHIAIGEKSVWYLCSKLAATEIKQFNPEARIIVMLRNPVDMMYSLHGHFLWDLNEDITDFRAALAAEPERKLGRRIPAAAGFPQGLAYREVARYSRQVERFLDVFAPERVCVTVFEEFVTNPRAAYEEILSFLGVPSDGRTDFGRVNPGRTFRSKPLAHSLHRPPKALLGLGAILKAMLGTDSLGLWRVLRRLNTKPTAREPLAPELRRELGGEFRRDIKRLSGMVGKDLSLWWPSES